MTKELLLVEDDLAFARVLTRALTRYGFTVHHASDREQMLLLIAAHTPTHAIVDLQIPDASGLTLIPAIKAAAPLCNIIVLTGYASIATAIEAIKLGATYYLAKPAEIEDIVAAFDKAYGDDTVCVESKPMSLKRLSFEHIQKVLADCGGNISKAAKSLGVHRRTLQRKLQKKPVRE